MELNVVVKSAVEYVGDGVIVNLYEGGELSYTFKAMDEAFGGHLTKEVEAKRLSGGFKKVTVFDTFGKMPFAKLAVVGMGKVEEFTYDRLRAINAAGIWALQKAGCRDIGAAFCLAPIKDFCKATAVRMFTESVLLSTYKFDEFKTKDTDKDKCLKSYTVLEFSEEKKVLAEEGMNGGTILGNATNLARRLSSLPSCYLTPTKLAEIGREVAEENGMDYSLLGEKEMEKEGMMALLGVGQGSDEESKLFVMKYMGNPESKEIMGLVGKGITFDSGGISIKPSKDMDHMRDDMSGGAAVVGAMQAIAKLKLPINVYGVVGAAENMPSGKAQKPGDIKKAMNGMTIEILNTDAEGRLLLADAVCYAQKIGATQIVDVCTLTGSVGIALGDACAGYVSTCDDLADTMEEAAEVSGERVWRMPIFDKYKEQIKSEVADLKNTGGRLAGMQTGGLMIGAFCEDVPWLHLDIAAMVLAGGQKAYMTKGMTGYGVRLLTCFVRELAKPNM